MSTIACLQEFWRSLPPSRSGALECRRKPPYGDRIRGSDFHTLWNCRPTATATKLPVDAVITTDRRTYHVRLVSTSATALSSMRWIYPQEELLALRRQAEAERAAVSVATGLSVEALHFNYTISGDRPAWRPLRAFDDGQKTYVEFPASLASSEAPPLFLVDREGKAELVNYRLSGRFYVVDRIFDAAELRLGLKKQQVVRIDRVLPGGKRRGA